MFVDSIIQIKTYFRNLTLNALGVERSIFERLDDNDVDSVVNMMEQHDSMWIMPFRNIIHKPIR